MEEALKRIFTPIPYFFKNLGASFFISYDIQNRHLGRSNKIYRDSGKPERPVRFPIDKKLNSVEPRLHLQHLNTKRLIL